MSGAVAVRFDDFRVDAANAQLWRGQESVKLSHKALSVLEYLVTRPGQLVSKDELFDAVWPEATVSEGALTECIREVRQALGENARKPRYVETVHRRGYRFIGELRQAERDAPSARRADLVVGRAAELAQLQDWYHQALSGQRQLVFVAGEAGIGKTTLVQACVAKLQAEEDCWIAEGQCIEQYGAGEAYMPVLEALGRLCRGIDGEQVKSLLNQHAPTWLAQMPGVLDADALETLQRRTMGVTQQRMLREMAEALEALSASRPLVLVLEDLHWSDYSTVELLATLARRRESARLLVLGTHRIVDLNLAEHHLKHVKQELQFHDQCHELTLDFLNQSAVEAYLVERFGAGALSSELPALIHRHTDGNPLFVARITEDLVRRNVLQKHDGQYALSEDSGDDWVTLPESLRQFIAQQFTQLSNEEKSIVEAASVAGVEFSAAAVAAGASLELDLVESHCARLAERQQFLIDKGVVEWPNGTVAARYSFIHALYQEVFYQRLTPNRRRVLHLRTGEGMEAAYGERAGDIAAQLALHFERGKNYPLAIKYLLLAGQQGAQRSANTEAVEHLGKGLDLIPHLVKSEERDQQELALRAQLGPVLIATQGYGAAETAHCFGRAQELTGRVRDSLQLFPVLYGSWVIKLTWAQFQTAREMAEQFLHLAKQRNDREAILTGHRILGFSLSCLGEFAESRASFEKIPALYQPGEHASLAARYGQDPKAAGGSMLGWDLWHLGYPDQAVAVCDQAVQYAGELNHSNTRGYVETFGAARIQLFRRDREGVERYVDSVTALCEEQKLVFWVGFIKTFKGWVLTEQGDHKAAIDTIQDGLEALDSTSTLMFKPHSYSLLAQAYLGDGRISESLRAINQALATADRSSEHWITPELYRLNGEILLRAGPTLDDTAAAESCFEQSLALARSCHARSWELRTSISVATLWQAQGKQREARDILSSIYGWFKEGFGSRDLIDAKALLDSLD